MEGTACVYPKNLEANSLLFSASKGTAVIGGLAVNRVETWNFAEASQQDDVVAALAGNDPKDVYGSGHNLLYADYANAIANDTQLLD